VPGTNCPKTTRKDACHAQLAGFGWDGDWGSNSAWHESLRIAERMTRGSGTGHTCLAPIDERSPRKDAKRRQLARLGKNRLRGSQSGWHLSRAPFPPFRRRPGLQTVIATRCRIPTPAATDKMSVVQAGRHDLPADSGRHPFSPCTTDILSVVQSGARDRADNRIRHSEH